MLLRALSATGLIVAGLLAPQAVAVAQVDQQGYVTTDLNLRAGPGTEYPVVVVMRAGSPVYVHGCLDGWYWCDLTIGDYRGWASGSYIAYDYQSQRVPLVQYGPTLGVPIIAFSLGSYWDNHYRARPWYNQRQRWVTHYDRNPPRFRSDYGYGRTPAYNRPDYRRDYRPDRRPPQRVVRPDYRDRDYRDRDRDRRDWNRDNDRRRPTAIQPRREPPRNDPDRVRQQNQNRAYQAPRANRPDYDPRTRNMSPAARQQHRERPLQDRDNFAPGPPRGKRQEGE